MWVMTWKSGIHYLQKKKGKYYFGLSAIIHLYNFFFPIPHYLITPPLIFNSYIELDYQQLLNICILIFLYQEKKMISF